jgi:hypothetical protein
MRRPEFSDSASILIDIPDSFSPANLCLKAPVVKCLSVFRHLLSHIPKGKPLKSRVTLYRLSPEHLEMTLQKQKVSADYKQTSMRDMLIDETQVLRIYASKEWNHSLLRLVKGGIYRFSVMPSNQEWESGSAMLPIDADGRNLKYLFAAAPFLRMPSAKWFSLIGSIDKKRRYYFKIGKSVDLFVAPASGELICFANDLRMLRRENNQGHLDLMVTRLR